MYSLYFININEQISTFEPMSDYRHFGKYFLFLWIQILWTRNLFKQLHLPMHAKTKFFDL